MISLLRIVVLMLASALLLGACGDAEDTPVADAPPPEDAEAEADVTVAVAGSALGDILVDGDGMTLYLFEPDEQGEPTCYDDCAQSWPPLVADGAPQAGEGADQDLLGATERTDGATQVTYDGWPLYHFAADAGPGDTAGQGVNDVWWVLAPDGSAVRDEAADDTGPAADY